MLLSKYGWMDDVRKQRSFLLTISYVGNVAFGRNRRNTYYYTVHMHFC